MANRYWDVDHVSVPREMLGSSHVTVVDIAMPFSSMVVFMVKWTLATISAGLIVGGVGAFLYALVLGIRALSTDV